MDSPMTSQGSRPLGAHWPSCNRTNRLVLTASNRTADLQGARCGRILLLGTSMDPPMDPMFHHAPPYIVSQGAPCIPCACATPWACPRPGSTWHCCSHNPGSFRCDASECFAMLNVTVSDTWAHNGPAHGCLGPRTTMESLILTFTYDSV